MIRVGFTGTQRGMSQAQKDALYERIFRLNGISEFHHGDCIGADYQAQALVRKHSPDTELHIHPPTDGVKRAFCKHGVVYPPKHYLARNHDIVDRTDVLLAAPYTDTEQLRSDTWATIRYARKQGKQVIILKR
jgi:hypothetical protein